jgi:hypothetical protein
MRDCEKRFDQLWSAPTLEKIIVEKTTDDATRMFSGVDSILGSSEGQKLTSEQITGLKKIKSQLETINKALPGLNSALGGKSSLSGIGSQLTTASNYIDKIIGGGITPLFSERTAFCGVTKG